MTVYPNFSSVSSHHYTLPPTLCRTCHCQPSGTLQLASLQPSTSPPSTCTLFSVPSDCLEGALLSWLRFSPTMKFSLSVPAAALAGWLLSTNCIMNVRRWLFWWFEFGGLSGTNDPEKQNKRVSEGSCGRTELFSAQQSVPPDTHYSMLEYLLAKRVLFAWHGSAVLHSAFGSGRALCAVWCVRACGSPGHHMQISTTPPLSESVRRRDPQVGTPNLLCCRSYTSKGSCSAQK